VQFEGKPLRDLLIEAIRYGEQPETKARLTRVVERRSTALRSATCWTSGHWPTT
jgi:hypothetical protein